MIFSDGRNITQINMNLIDKVADLIAVLNQIEEKILNFPFHSFSLLFVDSGGTHIIRYSDMFEESKSAVIHQLNKILKFPQNYLDVNVFINTVEEPENERTLYIKKQQEK